MPLGVLMAAVLVACLAAPAAAQEPAAIEVATVRPSGPDSGPMALHRQPSGRLVTMNTPLTFLISWAFNLGDGQLLNAPRGADSARFDIVAQPPPGPLGPGELQMMLRTLLARRFGLVAHSELRKVLSRQLAAPVEDGTRITGSFDFTLEWQPDGAPAGDVTRPSLFTALREQLGLRLDVRRTQVEVMVIDRLNLTAVTD